MYIFSDTGEPFDTIDKKMVSYLLERDDISIAVREVLNLRAMSNAASWLSSMRTCGLLTHSGTVYAGRCSSSTHTQDGGRVVVFSSKIYPGIPLVARKKQKPWWLRLCRMEGMTSPWRI